MKILAVTGSSGSGKTTVSKMFLNFEETVLIDTDKLAREMADEDEEYLNDIILAFGDEILDEFGKLNRKKLSRIIANDSKARRTLNNITKECLMPKLDELVVRYSDKKLIVVDIPILYENELEEYFDKVLAVISNRDEQVRRICERDNLSVEDANLRLDMQLDNSFFIDHADFIIENFGKNEAELYNEVGAIYADMIKV